ncbi:MAG: hypothetical protein AABY46_05285 [Nitrospirota bacterium]
MLVSYWHKDGMEVYRVKDAGIETVASGRLDAIRPFTGWGRKVMIVGRDRLLWTRKRYPPTTGENLAKAIQMDLKELFPLKDPAFSFRIFEQTPAYSLVDIWTWDRSDHPAIRKIFPWSHIVPEDAAFVSDESEIRVLDDPNGRHLMAHNKDGFLGRLSLRHLTGKDVELFLRSLGKHGREIKTIRLQTAPGELELSETIPVVHEPPGEYPPCLKDIRRLNLKPFRSAPVMSMIAAVDFVPRLVLYLMIVYAASLYITQGRYDRTIQETSQRLDGLTKTLSAASLEESDPSARTLAELQERRKSRVEPLEIMNALARSLRAQSAVTRMVLNENSLELSIASKEPLEVIRGLSTANCVQSVKLRGSPFQGEGNVYNFLLTLELKPCS